MSNYQAITNTTHQSLYWKRSEGYAFSKLDGYAPITVQEISRAALSLPIGFIATEDDFSLVAIQGLKPDQNLLVNDKGQWLVPYIPAAYRGYPFALAQTQENNLVLCVDHDSGLVNEYEGEVFFDADEQPTQPVKDVLNFLQQVRDNLLITNQLCKALQQFTLIVPWPVKLQGNEGVQEISGLYKIDEKALNALPAEDFEQLRQTGALPLIYCQLLSMQHMVTLGQLAEAHAKIKTDEVDIESLFGEQDDTLKFNF